MPMSLWKYKSVIASPALSDIRFFMGYNILQDINYRDVLKL